MSHLPRRTECCLSIISHIASSVHHCLVSVTRSLGLPRWHSGVNNLSVTAGDACSIPGSGRSHRGGNGSPLQYSCLGNSMGWGAGRATVCGVTKSWTQVSKSRTEQTKLGARAEVGEITKDWDGQEIPKGVEECWALKGHVLDSWKGGEDIPGEDIWVGREINVHNISKRQQEEQRSWERRQGWSEHWAHESDFTVWTTTLHCASWEAK